MSVYVEKTGAVYGQGYGVRVAPYDGGEMCAIYPIDDAGVAMKDAQPIVLEWEVAKVFGKVLLDIASERQDESPVIAQD